MFGLMHPQKCCSNKCDASYHNHRMHYCGTCKTIGNQYGHSARLILNYDIVFLSELLSELYQEDLTTWQDNYQAINKCFTMPEKKGDVPFSLKFAADANVVLAALKVDDNIKDKGKWRWYFARFFYARKFKKAFYQLETHHINKEELWQWIETQQKREKDNTISFESIQDHLHYYAEPTAKITSQIFKQGGQHLSSDQQEVLAKIGYQFGQLNYILDAFEDLEQDIFESQFNPLIHWFDAIRTLEEDQLEEIRQILLQLQDKISANLASLPNAERFASRLTSNLALRIYRERIIPQTLKERIKKRYSDSQEFASKIVCNTDTWLASIQHFLISLSAFLMPSIRLQMTGNNAVPKWDWKAFRISVLPFLGLGDDYISSSSSSHRIDDDGCGNCSWCNGCCRACGKCL